MKNETVPLGNLTEDPDNARAHDARNLEAIAQSLTRFGQVEPLVVNKRSGFVVGGNGRLEAMRSLGWESAWVAYVDLDSSTAKALGLALNRTAELAEWDYPKLSDVLRELEGIEGIDHEGLGWERYELDQLLAASWEPPSVDSEFDPTTTNPTKDTSDLSIKLEGERASLFLEVCGKRKPAEFVIELCAFYLESKQ